MSLRVARFSRRVVPRHISKPVARLFLVAALLSVTVAVSAQFGGRRGGGEDLSMARRGLPDRPAGFTFCRLAYNTVRSDPSGSGWAIEYPDAEFNFMTRLSQFTTTQISRWGNGSPGSTVILATDPELFSCPFLMISSPGTAGFNDQEVANLREYLLKGGFLWGDDFWGNASWNHWYAQIRRILPEYTSEDIPPNHPLFTSFYSLTEVPQIPSLNRWRPGESTSELGAESAIPHLRGIFDDEGRLMVLMTHNTDISDGWEREADLEAYFELFSAKAYGIGINVAVYMMSH